MAKTKEKPEDITPAAEPEETSPKERADALKVRLETLIAERETLIADRDRLQADLVKVWGSGDVNPAVDDIAHNENKITALGTVIDHAEAEYRQALGESFVGEYAALRDEIAGLKVKQQAMTADLTAAQQAYELSRYETERAESAQSGAMGAATSLVEPAVMPNVEMTERYGRAVEAHEAALKADAAREQAVVALRAMEMAYLQLYHETSLKERRAHELGSLTGSPFDPGMAYRPG